MTETHQDTASGSRAEHARTWYVLSVRCAVVAGAFSVVVAALLISNYLAYRAADPLDSQQLAGLKAELPKRPADAGLKDRIRKLDLNVRRQHFHASEFAVTGAWLLVGGLAVFVLSLKYALTYRKKLPDVKGRREEDVRRTGTMSRGAVTALAAVVISAAIVVSAAYRGGRMQPGVTVQPADDPAVAAVDTAEQPTAQQPTAQQPTAPAISQDPAKNWPRFRGPGGLGVCAFTNVPSSWNGATGDGILWKTPVPMPGQNSPVVWGNRVFLTGADKEKREVYCFNADTGAMVWKQEVKDVPGSPLDAPEPMQDAGYAAPTAVTDGQRVCVMFANADAACFDFLGRKLWARGYGKIENAYGYAASLAISGNLVLIQLDQGSSAEEGKSKLIALDIRDGTTAWEAARPVPNSWATPIVVNSAGRDQIITAANPWVIAYNPADGSELWRAECLSGDVAPSPAYADGLVFVAQDGAGVTAIRTDGQGDVTKTHIAWKASEGLPDICSPLAAGKFVFLVQTYGTVTCYDAKAGTKLGQKDFGVEFNSSPTLVGSNIYLLEKKGVMHILEASGDLKEVATADLGEESTCCPAYADGRIYIRGKQNLYCIEARK